MPHEEHEPEFEPFGADGHDFTVTTGSITEERTRLDRVTILHVDCAIVGPAGPVDAEISIVNRGLRHVLKSGVLRSPNQQIFAHVDWDGEIDMPRNSFLATQIRNDTGSSVVASTDWTWRSIP